MAGVVVDLDGIVLVDHVVLELTEPQQAGAEHARVEDVALLQQHLAPENAVPGALVAGELEPPDPELVVLLHRHQQVRHQILAFDDLQLHVREDVAAVAVELSDLLDPLVDQVRPQPTALRLLEHLAQQRFRQHLGAFDVDLAQLPARPLLDRHDQGELPLAALEPLRVRLALDHLEFRLADLDILVAEAAVEILDLVEILLDGGRVEHVALANPGQQIRLLRLLHLAAELAGGEHLVALEVDLADLDPAALVNGDENALLARARILHLHVDPGEAEAPLFVELLDRLLEAGQFAEVERQTFIDRDALPIRHVADVAALQLLQPVVVERGQERPFCDRHPNPDTFTLRHGLDGDVVDELPLPQLLDPVVQAARIPGLAGFQIQVVAQALLAQRLHAGVLHRCDRTTDQELRRGRRRQQERGQEQPQQRQRREAASIRIRQGQVPPHGLLNVCRLRRLAHRRRPGPLPGPVPARRANPRHRGSAPRSAPDQTGSG